MLLRNLPFVPIAAIFDIDETILDNGHQSRGLGYHEEYRRQAAHEIGHEQGIKALEAVTYEQSRIAFRSAHEHTFSASLWNLLCMLGLRSQPRVVDTSDPLMVAITKRKDDLYANALRTIIQPIPHTQQLLEAVHAVCGRHMAIASTALRRDIELFLQVHNFQRFFAADTIISLENLQNAKPHPEAFIRACDALHLTQKDYKYTIAFEDAPNGVASAKQAGLFVIARTTQYSTHDLQSAPYSPDTIVDEYSELLVEK